MQPALIWFRLLLTILVIGYPLFLLTKRIYHLFSATTKHLQDQIDIAKDRIRIEPEHDEDRDEYEDEAIENDELFLDELSDKLTESLLLEKELDEPLPAAVSTTKIKKDPIEQAAQTTEVATENDSKEGTTSDELLGSPTAENKQSASGNSAEKMNQTVDDIKYAALTYKERGKKDDYEKKLIEGISLVGDHEEFLTMLADHYFEEGHYVKAGTLLKKIIHANPENHRAVRQLGQIYANDGDKETAKLLLEKARDLKHDNPKYLISLVEIYYEENNIKECITIVEKLSRLRPTNIDYLLTLGKLHEELNQPTKAHSYYMKVQELNPTNDEAKQAIRRLL